MYRASMYIDGIGLADILRKNLPKEVKEFLGTKIPRDAHHLSSIVNWNINGKFYKMPSDKSRWIKDKLASTLAHASKNGCGEIKGEDIVLCIHKNERGVLVYNEHLAGQCPHVLEMSKEFNKLFPDPMKGSNQ
jgi:hypothetical protein